MKIEEDPNGFSPRTPGAKLDKGKAPIFQGVLAYFPLALEKVALVSLGGAEKYSWNGFLEVEDGPNRYANALARHLTEESFGPHDQSGQLHAAHAAWNALARLELLLREASADPAPEQLEMQFNGVNRRRGI